MTVRRTLSGLVCAILLGISMSSCLVGPELQDPEIVVEEQYRFDSLLVDSIGNLLWWDLFPDTFLYNYVSLALDTNPTVQQAVARVIEAEAFIGFTKADQYPNFQGQIQAQRSNIGFISTIEDPQNLFLIAPAMDWEIDFWGKYRHATRAARQDLLATQSAQRIVLLDLVTAIATNYILLLTYDNQLEIAKRTVESRQNSTRIIQARYDYGVVAEIDLNQAEIQEAIALAAVPFFEREIYRTENVLSILLGISPRALQRGVIEDWATPPEIPPGMPSEILARRPDILEAYYALASQNELIGVAKAKRLPNINISAVFGLAGGDVSTMFTAEGIAWSIGAGLLQPIFQFGKNKRRVEIEEERMRQLAFNYQNVVLNAYREVEDALVDIDTYERELASRIMQRDAAVNAAQLSRKRYDGGETSYLEVLDSERSQFDAELQTSDVQAAYLLSYIDLYKALGGGWLTREEQQRAEELQRQLEEEENGDQNN